MICLYDVTIKIESRVLNKYRTEKLSLYLVVFQIYTLRNRALNVDSMVDLCRIYGNNRLFNCQFYGIYVSSLW